MVLDTDRRGETADDGAPALRCGAVVDGLDEAFGLLADFDALADGLATGFAELDVLAEGVGLALAEAEPAGAETSEADGELVPKSGTAALVLVLAEQPATAAIAVNVAAPVTKPLLIKDFLEISVTGITPIS